MEQGMILTLISRNQVKIEAILETIKTEFAKKSDDFQSILITIGVD